MTTNQTQIESYEKQAEAWPKATTEDAVEHHEAVLSQAQGIGEKPPVVNGVVIDPQQVMRDALIAHRERQSEQTPAQQNPEN